MRARTLAALVLAIPLLLLGACGNDGDAKATGGDSVTELESEPGSGSDESETTEPDRETDTTDITMPDLSDMSIPDFDGMEGLGDCLSQATAYASLAMSALGGDNAAKAAADAVETLKEALPDDLQDDLAELAKGYRTAAEKGLMAGGEAMDTPAFNKADQAISDYFEETCAG